MRVRPSGSTGFEELSMKALVRKLKHFLRQCGGPTAVEYAIVLLLVIFGAMTAVSLLGNSVGNSIGSTAETLPSGGSGEDSGESAPDEKSGNNNRNRRNRQRGRRGQRRRRRGRSAANFSGPSLVSPSMSRPRLCQERSGPADYRYLSQGVS